MTTHVVKRKAREGPSSTPVLLTNNGILGYHVLLGIVTNICNDNHALRNYYYGTVIPTFLPKTGLELGGFKNTTLNY